MRASAAGSGDRPRPAAGPLPAARRSRRTSFALLAATAAGLLALVLRDRSDGVFDPRTAWGGVLATLLLGAAALALLIGWRRRWRQYLLAAASLALVLGALELVLPRLFPYLALPRWRGVRSRAYHHLNPPRRTMFAGVFAESTGEPVLVVTNEDGLRTTHSRAEFGRYPHRVALLGDSYTFGFGVRQDAAFPQQVERRLRTELGADQVAVLNAGIISYSPLLEWRLLRGALAAYRPQIVLLFLDATDFGDDAKYLAELGGDPEAPFPFADQRDLVYRGAVAELLRPAWEWLRPFLLYPLRQIRELGDPGYDYYEFAVTVDGVVETNRFFIYRHPLAATRPWLDSTLANVRRAAAAAREMGAEFGLVVLPRYHHWNDAECPRNWERDQYRVDEPYEYAYLEYFAAARSAVDFPIVDLLPAFRAAPGPLVFPHDPHWNERGHEVVAAAVSELLLARLRPPPAPGP